ncbi:MAG: SHOCT domain-containing protein [Friedmanniella sp.]|jgi:type VI protein secretion system component VasK
MDFSDFFWLLVWSFFFVAYLMVLFQVIGDLFRDQELSGWAKAAWVVALIVVPFLSLLVYLIARGRGMGRRQEAVIRQAQSDTEQYIKSVAAQASPVDQVTSAKALLDEGTISQPEYERLKAKALA